MMIIKELKLLSEALWESVKTDLKFFAPIQVFVKNLSEVDYTKIESFQDVKRCNLAEIRQVSVPSLNSDFGSRFCFATFSHPDPPSG